MHSSGDPDRIVVDTYAWVEYFSGSDQGLKAKKILEGKFEIFTPSIVIAELSDKYRRENMSEWEIRFRFIKLKTKILFLDEATANRAGELKQILKKNYKDAGLADAIVWAHALDMNARLITGDKHLKNLENSIDITN